MPNRFTPIQPDTPEDQKNAIINTNFAQLDNENVKKLMDDSTGNHRIFLDGSAGSIKIAKPGFDVTTATDAQLAFNSNQNQLKVVATGTNAASGAGMTAGVIKTLTIPHNLGFTPIPLVFFADGSLYRSLPTWLSSGASGGNVAFQLWADCVTDSTNLYIELISGTTTTWGDYNFKWYLLQETAN